MEATWIRRLVVGASAAAALFVGGSVLQPHLGFADDHGHGGHEARGGGDWHGRGGNGGFDHDRGWRGDGRGPDNHWQDHRGGGPGSGDQGRWHERGDWHQHRGGGPGWYDQGRGYDPSYPRYDDNGGWRDRGPGIVIMP